MRSYANFPCTGDENEVARHPAAAIQKRDWNVKNINKFSSLKAGVAPVVLGLAMLSTPAVAQSAADEAEADTIVVTGTRIARPDVDSATPVTVVSAEALALSGTTRVEDLINTLPQAVGGQTAFIANGASGTATVDLRGLGSARTLVLVNGRRLQPGDPGLPVADLNQIPGSLVKRIEVLTGGASATYGADAVAGVVNFVMDTDFEGFQVDAQYGFYQHNNRNNSIVDTVGTTNFTTRDRLNARRFGYPDGSVVDGQSFDTTASFGVSFDEGRGHISSYLGYRQVSPIFQGNRDHSACALSLNAAGRNVCGGSSTAPAATIADLSFGGEFFASASGGGVWGPFAGAYNFAPINYFQRPDKRWTAGFFADYEVSSSFKPYAEFMFMDDRSVAQIAESGTFFNQYDIACDSPLLTPIQGSDLCGAIDGVEGAGDFVDTDGDGVADTDPTGAGIVPILIGKRNVEGGPRRDDLRHTAYRAVLGFKGDISSNWSYDVSGQFGTTLFAETYFNDLSSSRLTKAINAVVDTRPGSGTFGQIVCAINADATTSNDDAACAPYNPFQGIGIVSNPANGVTNAALTYVNTPGFQRGDTKEYIVSGYVNGQLGSLFGGDQIGVVLGAEYRKEMLELSVDEAFRTGDLAGQGGPTPNVAGQFSVKEVFGELLVPIVEDAPFMKSLSLELGYRYSDYSTAGTTDTYKILGEWSPIDAIKFRGGYNRAVRAPNVVNLYTPTRIGLFGGSDPCAGATPEFTAAQCANTGVTAALYGNIAGSPADQYNQFIGGNTALNPEKADTWTAGVVIQPRDIVPGLVIKADYFNIKVTDAIATYGAQTILEQCGLTGATEFCSLIQRAPVSGSLWVGQEGFVRNPTLNIGGVKTTGVDLAVSYGRAMLGGRATFDFNGTWLDSYVVDNGFTPAGIAGADGKYDCTGFFGSNCGVPLPSWRHTARFGYSHDSGVGISLRWRYVGATKLDEFSTDIDLGDTTPDARGKIKAYSFFDLTTSFDVSDNFSFNIGVNNILDKDPPVLAQTWGTTNGNTFVETYDPVGRYVFISGTMKF